MLKYLQTKIFLAGNIPTKDQMKFGEFRSWFSIFNKSTKLQKNRKRKLNRKHLPGACQPAHLPAQPSCRASELLGLARQARRCSTASSARATQLAAALLHLLAAS